MAWLQTQPHWWRAAQAQGLVSGDATSTAEEHEPGALLIGLSMLGALACLVPLAAFFVLVLGEHFLTGLGGLVTGVMALVAAGALLRGTPQAFLNCMAMVLWGMGTGLVVVSFGNAWDSTRTWQVMACAVVVVLMLLGAWLARTRWIAAVMGVVWVGAVYGLLMTVMGPVVLPFAGLLLAGLWWQWLQAEPKRLAQPNRAWAAPRWAAFADAAAVGLLFGVATGANEWLLLQSYWWEWGGSGFSMQWVARAVALVAVLLSTGGLLRQWQSRGVVDARSHCLVVLAGLLLAVAAWFSSALGVVAVVAAAALLSARWRIAALCAVMALGLLVQFYYRLDWSLAVKGLGLAALGALLMLGLWLLQRSGSTAKAEAVATTGPASAPRTALAWIIAGAVLVFGLVNWDVRSKEQVIAHGQRILVPLVPVDPRSLMQGDYMALNFDLPPKLREGLENELAPVQRVRATVDARGVAQVRELLAPGAQAAAGEVVLPLKRLKGRWVLVTDAYFFPEGQGEHFAMTKFGDFRVLPDGRALLVGLADAAGAPVLPLPGRSIWERVGRVESTSAMRDDDVVQAPVTDEDAVIATDAAASAAPAPEEPPAAVRAAP